MLAARLALVLTVAVAGVLGLHVMTGIAAAVGISALVNAYPRKARS